MNDNKTNSHHMHTPNLGAPKVEQVSEYRNSTRRAGEAAPPRAAEFGKGATNINEIREAAEARRKQSESWRYRDVGKRTPGSRDNG
jgi:hypothetical protein